MSTAEREPNRPCPDCGSETYFRDRDVWFCLGCYDVPRCPPPDRWLRLGLPESTVKARMLAGENDVDLTEIPGSGKDGKIVAADVRGFVSMWERRPRRPCRLCGGKTFALVTGGDWLCPSCRGVPERRTVLRWVTVTRARSPEA